MRIGGSSSSSKSPLTSAMRASSAETGSSRTLADGLRDNVRATARHSQVSRSDRLQRLDLRRVCGRGADKARRRGPCARDSSASPMFMGRGKRKPCWLCFLPSRLGPGASAPSDQGRRSSTNRAWRAIPHAAMRSAVSRAAAARRPASACWSCSASTSASAACDAAM